MTEPSITQSTPVTYPDYDQSSVTTTHFCPVCVEQMPLVWGIEELPFRVILVCMACGYVDGRRSYCRGGHA